MGTCATRVIPADEEYYINKIESYNTDNSLKETVKLEPKLKNISNGRCKVDLFIFTDAAKTTTKSGGGTEEAEVDYSSKAINFEKFFVMEYFFEKEQPIEFRISGSINTTIKTTLPSIMGSRGQTFTRKIDNDVIFEIKGFSYKAKITSTLTFNVKITGNDIQKYGLLYTINSKGSNKNPSNSILYKSELKTPLKGQNSIMFKNSSLRDIYIAPDGDYASNFLSVEINDAKHTQKLGAYSGPLKNLINTHTNINLKHANCDLYVDCIKNYSFIDYLRGGMQINFSVAIDFTGSNGRPELQNSLHYLGGPNPNAYEVAIKSCGSIVAYYDYDQKFPAFGFGGKFFGSNQACHCYPLNGNMDDPEVFGIDGILSVYRNALSNTQLFGPTFFHYFIDCLNNKVKRDLDAENFVNYHVLMILTDGIIDDMDDTVNSLVEASFLPISVIIVGIGGSDFSNMDVLDADDEPLIDSNGRKADRDLVQFVPFRDFQNDGQKLAEQVLEEIPRQIVEYYQHKKIPPGEPIINV